MGLLIPPEIVRFTTHFFMQPLRRITVFCGSSAGTDKIYQEQAFFVGQTLALHNIELVYGGARVGLMGAVADGALQEGGRVTGVLPHFLQAKELSHPNLTKLILVESMHERKSVMHDLCDGAIVLPGGYGTMDELFEMLTWAQLGLHQKPLGMLNINGFYDSLLIMITTMVHNGFLKDTNQQMLIIDNTIEKLLQKMKVYQAPIAEKWLTPDSL